MTTAAWSSGNANTDDATFRAWGGEFSAKLAAVGLVQTADTGQINWTTVTRPAANGLAGYEVWRFDDAMQSTAPIYLKFWYGTANIATVGMMAVEMGTASDGAGTVSGLGTAIIRSFFTLSFNTSATATATPSYMCYVDGFFGVWWKNGAGNYGTLFIARTCDTAGVADDYGAMFWSYGNGPTGTTSPRNFKMLRYASPAVAVVNYRDSTVVPLISLSPGLINPSTLPSGDKQAYIVWGAFPDMRPIVGLCAVIASEFGAATTFSVAMVGSTPRTYLVVGSAGTTASIAGSAVHYLAMLWE